MIALVAALVLASTPAAPERIVSVDLGYMAHGVAAGDLLLPVELELPLWGRLRWTARAMPAIGLGVARGLISGSLRAGLRVFPFADDASGLSLSLSGGPDAVATVGEQPFFAFRLSASASLGWGFRFLDGRLRLLPAVELHPYGLGFPSPGLFFATLSVGYAY